MARQNKTASRDNGTSYDLFIVIVTLLSFAVLVGLVVLPARDSMTRILVGMDTLFCIFFFFDFLKSLAYAKNKWTYLKWGWLDLLGSIPMLPVLRIFRSVRLIGLLRSLSTQNIREVRDEFDRNQARSTLLATGIVTLIVIAASSMLVLYLERNAPQSNILTGEDAFWWAFVTITTVGYGEYYPVTSGGRAVAMILMTVGVGIFGVITSYLAQSFLKPRESKADNQKNDNDIENDLAAIKSELAEIKTLLAKQDGSPPGEK